MIVYRSSSFFGNVNVNRTQRRFCVIASGRELPCLWQSKTPEPSMQYTHYSLYSIPYRHDINSYSLFQMANTHPSASHTHTDTTGSDDKMMDTMDVCHLSLQRNNNQIVGASYVFFSFGSNQTTEFYEEEEKEKRAKHSNCSQHNVCHWTGAVSKNQNRKSHDWPNFN